MRFKSWLSNTFAIPSVIGVLSLFGLVLALLGEFWYDYFAWALVAVPIVTWLVAWCVAIRVSPKRK